jgi:uncharacterized protein YndB with AHSA1/START domain
MTAKEETNSTHQPADRILVITRVFDAPRSLVFEAWTTKEHLDQWCAPRGFTIPQSGGEFRPGGPWRSCMRAPDGTEYRLRGTYREIVQDELLVFTHAWEEADGTLGPETIVTVRFTDENGKTRLTFEQGPFQSIEARDGHKGGWTECLERLAEHIANLQRRFAS